MTYKIKEVYHCNSHSSDMAKALYAGIPIWVELQDSSRKGSIGRVSPVGKPLDKPQTWGVIDVHDRVYGMDKFDLHIEGKKPITINLDKRTVSWLDGYTGPSVFVFEKKEPKPVHKPMDILGHPIATGNMIVYTTPSEGKLRYGIVDSISDTGLTLEVKSIDLINAEFTTRKPWKGKKADRISTTTSYSETGRCEHITVIRTDLLTDLMTVRLSMR